MDQEDRLVFEMDTFLLIEYIKTAITVILETKFEEIKDKMVTENNNEKR